MTTKKRIITIVFPLATPSQNEWGHWHWSKQSTWKKDAMLLLRGAINAAGGRKLLPMKGRNRRHMVVVTDPSGSPVQELRDGIPVRATFTRYGHQVLDRENFIGGCKGLVDVMRTEGIIVDDSESWWHGTYNKCIIERTRAKQRTEIVLTWDEPDVRNQQSEEGAKAPEPQAIAEESVSNQQEEKPVATEKLFDFANADVDIRSVKVNDALRNGKQTTVTARIQLVVSGVDPARVTKLTDGQIQASPKATDEGANCIDVVIKRQWPACRYELRDENATSKRFGVTFTGRPVNRPKASLVDGYVSIHWTVEDSQLSLENAKNLLKCVEQDGITMTSTQIEETQGELIDMSRDAQAA